MLTVTPGSIANAGSANNLTWAFNSGAEAFDYLNNGESLTLTYTVRATDADGVFDDQTVAITITGTDEAPNLLSMSSFSFSEETDPDAQTFFGTDGDDTLLGSPGDDQLFGDYGDDILQGNGGHDTLEGGEGADRFILVAGDMDVDQILDFNTEEDSIVLVGFDFDELEPVQPCRRRNSLRQHSSVRHRIGIYRHRGSVGRGLYRPDCPDFRKPRAGRNFLIRADPCRQPT